MTMVVTTSTRRRRTALLPVAALLLSSSDVASSSSASSMTLKTVFDAIDVNQDGVISEPEYSNAMSKLLSSSDGGDADSSLGASASLGAPPLGLDSNPFAYQRKKADATSSNNNDSSNAGNAQAKFDNPKHAKDFLKGLFASFSAIIATEIGDKTFFIAAILSMKNDRMAVFGGAILALIIMTILSTMMGLVLPALMPKKYTHIIGGILFLYFGVKLTVESRGMEDKVSEELEEVEEELAEMSKKQKAAMKKKQMQHQEDGGMDDDQENGNVGGGDVEDGAAVKRRGGGKKGIKHAPSSSGLSAASDYSGSSWEAVFIQALTMTFLAEWGDRSQIATIALAAAKDPLGVTIGGCIGHSICTGMAVVGGRMLASRISEKSVAFYGGLVFLAFGLHSVFFED
jgi:putative Ca2+/H+ antiporter (TMEM165/GDT1 family)